MTLRNFNCISDCSDCCIYRQYYPSIEYGKIGVLVLPDEKTHIEKLAKSINISIKIVPRLAVGKESPKKIIAYQMMGKNSDGDLCPFLDIESKDRSPHGGFKCRIYPDRPLACKAYPLVNINKKVILDKHCKFCRKHSITSTNLAGLHTEIEALVKIKSTVKAANNTRVWRYATATGRPQDRHNMLPEGWVNEC